MKSKLTTLIFTLFLCLSFAACSSDSADNKDSKDDNSKKENVADKEKTPEKSPEKTETSANPDAETGPADGAYAEDWEMFHAVLESKKIPSIESYIDTDDLTAEGLLDMITPECLAHMKETPYSSLKAGEYNEYQVKEYVWQESGQDEEGNTWESALFFYFLEGAEGLKIVGFLAAG